MKLSKFVVLFILTTLCLPVFSLTCNEIHDSKIKADLSELIFKNLTDVGVICEGQKTCSQSEKKELRPYWDDYFSNQLIKKYSEFIEFGLDKEVIRLKEFSNVDCRFQVHVGFGLTRPILESDKGIFKYGFPIPYALKTGYIEEESWNYLNYVSCKSRLSTDCNGVMQFAHGFARYSLLKRLAFARRLLTDVETPSLKLHESYLAYFQNNLSERKIAVFEQNAFPKIWENRSLGRPTFEGIEMIGPISSASEKSLSLTVQSSSPSNSQFNCPVTEYPEESKRLQEEGTVVVRFKLSSQGKLLETMIEKSSGFRRLDEAARKQLNLCEFKKGLKEGASESNWVKMSFTYKLQ